MIPGPKSTCRLQKPTETQDALGSVTTTWADVQQFKGILATLKASELIFTNKDSVFATYRLMMSYSEITQENKSEVKEKNRIVAGSTTYDIQGVHNYHDRHWELDLLDIK